MCSSLKSKTKPKTMCMPSLKNNLFLIKVANHLSLQRDMIFLLVEGFISIFFLILFIHFYFWLHLVLVAFMQAFFSYGERGLLFLAVHGLVIVVASLVAEHGP